MKTRNYSTSFLINKILENFNKVVENLKEDLHLVNTKIFIVKTVSELHFKGQITLEELTLICAFDSQYKDKTSVERRKEIQELIENN